MRLFAVYFFLILLPFTVFARDIHIYIEDEELSIPLEGAAVILRSGQQFFCDENGVALVTLPDNRMTIITIAYPGYDSLRMTIPAAAGSGEIENFSVGLRIGSIMQGRELVIEAPRPETSETRSGRSVAITGADLARTAEIGIIEDVMSSVKLLPGVGYSGMFNAMPSIRGGDPGDLMASFDGFYLENPYYWMGAISIFDPKMVSSARLSHGVFSVRYGHTVSGLLEISSKTPSPSETELEAAFGTSAASLNLSVPFGGRGGLLMMGSVTYWDIYIWAVQQLSRVIEDENLALINSISTAPFIRSAALSMNYRFSQNTDFRLNGFFGSDGVGAEVNTDYSRFLDDEIEGIVETRADYGNYQSFLIAGLNSSPMPKIALRFAGGVGFNYTNADAFMNNEISTFYNEKFLGSIPSDIADDLRGTKFWAPNIGADVLMKNSNFNAQFRADIDYDLGKGFIAAVGVQELYSMWIQDIDVSLSLRETSYFSLLSLRPDKSAEIRDYISGKYPGVTTGELSAFLMRSYIIDPINFDSTNVTNHGFTSSAYTLVEFTSSNQRFAAELGLRADHLYFIGKGFTVNTKPALNPRLNIDFIIVKNAGFIDSLSITAGSGLFSSSPSLLSFFNPSQFGIDLSSGFDNIEFKFNRTWTTIIGIKLDFLNKYSFNIEGYYKRVFDRAYITVDFVIDPGSSTGYRIVPEFMFDGIGNVWGFDFQLQRLESRFIDGWISYTFTWAQYRDPSAKGMNLSVGNMGDFDGVSTNRDWYFPSFHRYHNINLVLNIKPLPWLSIGVRFGLASGQETNRTSYSEPKPYPVFIQNEDGTYSIIQKFYRERTERETIRSAWSLPLDIKFSFYPANRYGRGSLEIYVAGENLMSLFYNPTRDRTTMNEYTGRMEEQASSANFDIPIPMISFGFKWRY